MLFSFGFILDEIDYKLLVDYIETHSPITEGVDGRLSFIEGEESAANTRHISSLLSLLTVILILIH